MRVELLYTDDDPAYMAARQNLVEVLNEDAFETTIQMIAVRSLADAELLGFPGSPTIRIDGEDIHPEGASVVGLGRRTYRPSSSDAAPGVPDKALIRSAVERARGWGHAARPG
jgi:hypothetical protein